MRKHILNLLVFTLFGISSVMAQFSGSGTLSDPYIIASDQDLQNLATAVNAGNDFAGNYLTLLSRSFSPTASPPLEVSTETDSFRVLTTVMDTQYPRCR